MVCFTLVPPEVANIVDDIFVPVRNGIEEGSNRQGTRTAKTTMTVGGRISHKDGTCNDNATPRASVGANVPI